jgi:nitrate/nitrite transport system substrate-binding protein
MDIAKKVYRPDIYALAAKELIAEGKLDAADFPDFDTETGYKSPQTEFIDSIKFDGTQPNAYLEQFPIGLKGEEVIK